MVQKAVGDRFKVDREIARGGAARVFKATDANGTTVALKVLHPQLAVTVSADRFLREIKYLSRIEHPRITKLLDSGESEFLVYYVMTYVDGPTLRQHLDRARRLSVNDTLIIGSDLLDALGHAHGEGIVHRDVKPENIVVTGDGPVLVDFGIARAAAEAGSDRLTKSGFAVGSSSYMSPEQIQGIDDIDIRTDLYAVGCVLFECLAGRAPFTAPREEQVIRMHLETTAPDIRTLREEVPNQLAEAIGKALQTDRKDRWASAMEMQRALGGAA